MAAKSFGNVFVARDKKNKFSEISTSLKISMSLPSSLLYTIFNFRTIICLLVGTNSYIHSDVILKVSYIKRYFEIEGT